MIALPTLRTWLPDDAIEGAAFSGDLADLRRLALVAEAKAVVARYWSASVVPRREALGGSRYFRYGWVPFPRVTRAGALMGAGAKRVQDLADR